MSAAVLELRIAVPGEVGPQDPVPVSVALRKAGENPVVVNGRLLVGPRSARRREVWFEVRGPAGYRNTKRVQVNAGAPKPADFRRLEPGEAIEKTVDLARYESLHLPGEYSVRAHYENESRDERLGADPWVGSVESSWAAFSRRGS